MPAGTQTDNGYQGLPLLQFETETFLPARVSQVMWRSSMQPTMLNSGLYTPLQTPMSILTMAKARHVFATTWLGLPSISRGRRSGGVSKMNELNRARAHHGAGMTRCLWPFKPLSEPMGICPRAS